MNVKIARDGTLLIDDARIIFRNFRGEGSRFNKEGERNFSVVIDDEDIANELIEAGWNVKIKAPRSEDEEPFRHLSVKVAYGGFRDPKAYLISGDPDRPVELDEESIACLDNMDIVSVDLDIRPYHWTSPRGETGVSAYLQAIHVTQRIDRFAARYVNNN
jgi:hypothetical protein